MTTKLYYWAPSFLVFTALLICPDRCGAATWTTSGGSSLNTPRQDHVSALLPNGRVLVIGGSASGTTLSSAEIYDPSTGTWTNATSMSAARRLHRALLLPNGKILVVGGETSPGVASSACELYDPAAGTWAATGSMGAVRRGHTATLLGNGKVLVTGGDNAAVPLSTAELYDPAAGTWAATGSMGVSRGYHGAALLPDGKVLVAGGNSGAGTTYLSSAEIYDPGTGTWTPTNPMPQQVYLNTLTPIAGGKVLLAGGSFPGTVALSSAALYNINSGTWTTTDPLNTARANHTAVLLPDGRVLVAGGTDASSNPLSSAELYDPATSSWTAAGSMSDTREYHSATLLPGGRVLITSGHKTAGLVSTAEFYSLGTGLWSASGAMTSKRISHGLAFLPSGVVLAAGGSNGGTTLATAEYYNVSAGTWSATGTMQVPRLGPSLSVLPDGKALVAGGGSATAELYNGGVWSYTGSMKGRSAGFATVLLPGGKLLAAGGTLSGATVSTAETYDPLSQQWLAVGAMTAPRSNGHGAILLPTKKKILVFGGTSDGTSVISSAELYDPGAGTWAATGSLSGPRVNASVSLLPNGRVLVAGGRSDATTYLASAEIYDPDAGTWSPTGPMATSRENHASWLLPDGRVLVAGGQTTAVVAVTTAEIYDPASGAWTSAYSPLASGAGWNAGAAILPGGSLLMAGGSNTPGDAFSTSQRVSYTELDFAASTKSASVPRILTVAGSAAFPVSLNTGNYNITGTTLAGPGTVPRAYLTPLNGAGMLVDISSTIYGSVEQTIYQNQTSTTTFNITLPSDLQCGHYRLFAVTDGVPSTSVVVQITPTAPALTPSNPASPFSGITVSTIVFQWTASGEAGVDGFLAQVSTSASFTVSATTTAGTTMGQTNATFEGLLPDTTYFFRAAADNCGGAGSFAGSVSTSTLALPVTGISFPQVFPTSATVSWSTSSAQGYRVEASTDSNFGGTLFSASTGYGAAMSLAITGLSSGTAYFFQVGSLNWNGSPNFAASVTTTTPLFPGSIGALPFSAVLSTALVSNWASSFAPGTSYYAELSSGAFPNAFAGNLSSSTYESFAQFTNLSPNTTYFAQLSTNPVGAAPLSLGSTTTLANMPASLTVALTSVTATLNWSGSANPGYTQYTAQFSSTGFATLSGSSVTLSTSASFGALTPDTTYYFRVQAANLSGGGSLFASIADTATFAAPPSSASPSAVGASSMTFNWGANGNPLYTRYTIQISSDNFATLTASALVSGTSAAFTGLSPNTSYYAQVQALSMASSGTAFTMLPSTMTLPFAPAAAAPPFLTVDIASVTLQWDASGNQPGVIYTARVSTNNFTTINISSSSVGTSQLFGSGGAGAPLAPNTTHYFQVAAANALNGTSFVAAGTTVTLAAAPAATIVTGLLSNATTISWSANGNPAGTQYEIWRDASPAFPSPIQNIASTTSFLSTGLSPNTAYYFQVRSRNSHGLFSPFDAVLTTTTLPAPGAPGTPAAAALGVSSLSWTWSAAATALSYQIFTASNTASLIASTATTAFIHTKLSTNTAYGIVVGGFNGTLGPLSGAATLYTLAAPPASSTITAVSLTSATVSWSLNTNPAATTAEIQRSTDNAGFTALVATAATSYFDNSLSACSTYYYRVRNINGNGAATAFDSTILVATLPTIPEPAIAFAATPISGSRVSLSWTVSPTPGVTGYRLYYDAGTSTVSYAAALAVLTSTQTSYTTGVLTSSSSYRFALRTLHACGNEETAGTFASSGAQSTLVGVRAAIKTPDSGRSVSGNRVSVIAELVSGDISEVASVMLQFKPSSATAWANLFPANAAYPNPAVESPYVTQWNVTGLPTVNYDLRAVAISKSGVTDPTPAAVTVSVDPVNPDISESVDFTGQVQKVQLIDPAVANTIATSGASSDDPVIKVLLPAGSITGSTLTVTIESNPTIATAPPAGFETMISGLRIRLSNQQTVLPNGVFAILTMSYPASVIDPNKLQIYSMSENSGVWLRDVATVIDQDNRTVTGFTSHFSFFGIFLGGVPAPDLSGIRVYPVPWKPNGSNPDEGKPYNAIDPTSGVIFENLPSVVTLRIYTTSGRQVARFDTTRGTGALQWDGRNQDGRDVASGAYFAVITTPGAKSVVKKLAIIR